MIGVRIGAMLAGLLLGVSGCTTLGPDYVEPEIDWVETWRSGLYGQAPEDGARSERQDLEFWWHAFNDETLNKLIEIARRENPSLRIAGLAIVQSRALLGVASGSRYPQVQQATGSLARVDSWPTEGDRSGDHAQLRSYELGANVGWELDFWGRFKRGIESADAAFFGAISNHRNAQVLLSAQVAQAYFTYRTIQRQIEIARMNADLQKRSLDITRRLYRRGQDSELDLQQAKSQYLATASTIPGLELRLQQASNALRVLLGRSPGELAELTGMPPSLPTLDPLMIHELPARLLMRRPDVRNAAWRVAAQSAQIGVAAADLYPAISLVGALAWSGNSASGSTDALSAGLGPGFRWKLFHYDRIKNSVRVQDALLQQAVESYRDTVARAASEIDDAAISVVKTREQDALLGDAMTASRRALTLANTRYREGYSGFQRVLDAQRALATQSSNHVANQGAHISAVIALYKALGGGWRAADSDDVVPAATRSVMQQRTDWGDLLTAPLPSPWRQGGQP